MAEISKLSEVLVASVSSVSLAPVATITKINTIEWAAGGEMPPEENLVYYLPTAMKTNPVVVTADIESEDFSSLSEWTEASQYGGYVTANVSYQSRSCGYFYGGYAATYSIGSISQATGAIDDPGIIYGEIICSFFQLNTVAKNAFSAQIYYTDYAHEATYDLRVGIRFSSEGVYVISNGSDTQILGPAYIDQGNGDYFHTWSFAFDVTTYGSETITLWKDSVKVVDAVSFSTTTAASTNKSGTLLLAQTSRTVVGCATYVDSYKVGTSISEGGVGAYDTGETFEDTFKSPFSISVCIKPDDGVPSNGKYICGTEDSGGDGRVRMQLSSGTIVGCWGIAGVAGSQLLVTCSNELEDGAQDNYEHYVLVCNEAGGDVTGYIYKGGQLDSYVPTANNPITQSMDDYDNSTRNFTIGYYNDGYLLTYPGWTFDGYIKEFRIYDIALTAQQVLGLYSNDI